MTCSAEDQAAFVAAQLRGEVFRVDGGCRQVHSANFSLDAVSGWRQCAQVEMLYADEGFYLCEFFIVDGRKFKRLSSQSSHDGSFCRLTGIEVLGAQQE